jgi:exopolyphosphatase
MSLVLDHCKSTWDALSASPCADGTPAAECDAHLARIALAPILIDTTKLTSKEKTTDWDIRAAQLAESKLLSAPSPTAAVQSQSQSRSHPQPHAEGGYDRTAYYDTLAALKEQIQGLSYRDILRKDYKRWSEGPLALGVSTVVQGLGYVMREVGDKSRGAFLDALKGWAGEQRLDVAAVMTLSRPEGVFTRELLVWGLNSEGAKVVREFERRFGETLGLEGWNGGELDERGYEEGELRVCWRQKGVQYSRKQVAPMLREAMRESSKL